MLLNCVLKVLNKMFFTKFKIARCIEPVFIPYVLAKVKMLGCWGWSYSTQQWVETTQQLF